MKFMTISTLGGGDATINVAQVTHVVTTGMATRVHFSGGQTLDVIMGIGDLTLELATAAAN